MKKLIFIFFLLAGFFKGTAQIKVQEPEFVGQCLLLTSDSTSILLPEESTSIQAKASASLYLFGIGEVNTRVTIKGPQAKIRLKGAQKITLIVRCISNNVDPRTLFSITKFEVTEKYRRAKIGKLGTFSGSDISNKLSSIDFEAKKYGTDSYIISLPVLDRGEYGIACGGFNQIATFGINDSKGYSDFMKLEKELEKELKNEMGGY